MMRSATKNFLLSSATRRLLGAALLLLLSGCAFDLSYVKQVPVTFTPTTNGAAQEFSLSQDVTVGLRTGFPTHLKSGTRWRCIGSTEFGTVFTTRDQVLTVEASNIYEARLVVSDHCVTGFYLPVERKFVPVSRPVRIQTQAVNHPYQIIP